MEKHLKSICGWTTRAASQTYASRGVPLTNFQLTADETASYLKYAKLNLPRHTSYPAAPYWDESFSMQDAREALDTLRKNKNPISLYLHIPYCKQLCFYCACNKEIYPEERQKKNDPREALIQGLIQEMRFYGQALQDNVIEQVHFGGGTPTFLSPEQLIRLFDALYTHFEISEDAEIAVEIDPRVTTYQHLQALRKAGCNRLSLGVQDFSHEVQKAINRIQPYEMVAETMAQARSLGFNSINFDLIYGLPFQTLQTMEQTLQHTLTLGPDRVAFYRLALIPDIFKWQKSFGREHLPPESENIKIFLTALDAFTKHNYDFIGLDHFAKRDELLSEAVENQTLRRNFQGMTTGKELAIIAMGPSAVSQVPGYFWQNEKKTEDWLRSLEGSGKSFDKGMKLSADDRLRQELIQQIYCYGKVDWAQMSERLGRETTDYFRKDISSLEALASEGILTMDKKGFELSPILGRLLVRLVASRFDRYLQEETSTNQGVRFSQLG